jgi:hypothetical protein
LINVSMPDSVIVAALDARLQNSQSECEGPSLADSLTLPRRSFPDDRAQSR